MRTGELMNFYNENDPKAAAWLRELIKRDLIAPGVVDERSIIPAIQAHLAGTSFDQGGRGMSGRAPRPFPATSNFQRYATAHSFRAPACGQDPKPEPRRKTRRPLGPLGYSFESGPSSNQASASLLSSGDKSTRARDSAFSIRELSLRPWRVGSRLSMSTSGFALASLGILIRTHGRTAVCQCPLESASSERTPRIAGSKTDYFGAETHTRFGSDRMDAKAFQMMPFIYAFQQ